MMYHTPLCLEKGSALNCIFDVYANNIKWMKQHVELYTLETLSAFADMYSYELSSLFSQRVYSQSYAGVSEILSVYYLRPS